MKDSEIAALVHQHMGRLDEPLRTYALELAKAVHNGAVAAERERCAQIVREADKHGCACSDREELARVILGANE